MIPSDHLIQEILNGVEHIVSRPGTSQYGNQNGASACGLACLNLARVVFQKAQEDDGDILRAVTKKETAEVGICLWIV